jgi:hypothetical protein
LHSGGAVGIIDLDALEIRMAGSRPGLAGLEVGSYRRD